MNGELIKSASWLTANNMEQAMRIAEMLAKSTLVPKAYQGQPANVLGGHGLWRFVRHAAIAGYAVGRSREWHAGAVR
jgi:hypothetical protein